ncbi:MULTISPECIES: hypothetical protein [Burkholderia cepacia complex]|uniref:hypothetical protein n=1 Tax=Burkholderia cepacia complex TaxID=87882 RepID=UPI00064B8ABC|nr:MULTISPECIES: hypothetical protein [Burkholderia cepacia complex]AKM02735.1 hypothetical protein ABD05_21300 [Burkholderia pyrrocinia]
MRVDITGQGMGVAYLEKNAEGTSLETSDLVMSDPMPLFARYIDLGFYVSDSGENRHASVEVMSSTWDPASETQRWCLATEHMPDWQLRIATNLLAAMGIRSSIVQVEEFDVGLVERALVVDQGAWPQPLVEAPFTFARQLDERDSIRGCEVHIEFDQPLTKDVAAPICTEIETWANVVARSGFAPPGIDPANAGTFASGPYQYDSHTIASSFDYVFRVDLACFDALVGYLSRMHRDGRRIRGLTVS